VSNTSPEFNQISIFSTEFHERPTNGSRATLTDAHRLDGAVMTKVKGTLRGYAKMTKNMALNSYQFTSQVFCYHAIN
jgi:hypothetical protein